MLLNADLQNAVLLKGRARDASPVFDGLTDFTSYQSTKWEVASYKTHAVVKLSTGTCSRPLCPSAASANQSASVTVL